MEAHAETKLAVVVQDMLEIIVKNLFAKNLVKMADDVLDPIGVLVSMDIQEDTVKLITGNITYINIIVEIF